MKKLGLIGGIGPESTLLYYKKITEKVYKREKLFPPLLIESLDVYRVLSYCGQKDFAGLTAYLATGITNLAAGGAQVVAMTGNTPHIVFDELSATSPVPLVSSVAVTADYVAMQGLKRPLLLGTLFTMREDFFKKAFRDAGIEAIVPKEGDQLKVHEIIEKELEAGIVTEKAQKYFSDLVEEMIGSHHIDTLILGCTELPILFETMNISVPVVDVTDVHVEALIKAVKEYGV